MHLMFIQNGLSFSIQMRQDIIFLCIFFYGLFYPLFRFIRFYPTYRKLTHKNASIDVIFYGFVVCLC